MEIECEGCCAGSVGNTGWMDGNIFPGIMVIKGVEVCISSDCLYEYFVCVYARYFFFSQVNCRALCGLKSGRETGCTGKQESHCLSMYRFPLRVTRKCLSYVCM